MLLFVEYIDLDSVSYCLFFSLLFLILAYKTQLIFSFIDPFCIPLFQLIFSFFILLLNGYADVLFVSSFFIFLVSLFVFTILSNKVKSQVWVSNEIWDGFAKFILVLSLICNVVLIYNNGFILFSADVGQAKVEFYRGSGFFKRINQITIPILAIYCFRYFYLVAGYKNLRKVILLAAYLVYLLMTMGAKSGLVTLILYYAVFAHYSGLLVRKKLVFIAVVIALLFSVFMFYLIYGDEALSFFVYRMLSFSDGPVYYFADVASVLKESLDLTYPFQQLLVTFRVLDEAVLVSLGPLINNIHFGMSDSLYGPNPQVFVEADAILGNWALLYMLLIGAFVITFRWFAATAYSYSLLAMIFVPILIDSQYALNNLFNILIFVCIFSIYLVLMMMPRFYSGLFKIVGNINLFFNEYIFKGF